MRRLGCRSLLLALLVSVAGCMPVGLRTGDFAQPTVRTDLERAGIRDRQAAFAAVFCRHLAQLDGQDGKNCADWLPAAGAVAVADVLPAGARRPTVVFIPGIFGECVSSWVTPFSHDYPEPRDLGYEVKVVPVTGRGSSAQNARIIHGFFASSSSTFERAVVIGYSKGVTDFMVAAVQQEAASGSARVGAFVSVAGVVNGTPLASRGERLYQLLPSLRVRHCAPQDGGGVNSLAYQSAPQAARSFARLRKPYPSFSIAAVADGPVNPVLQPFHALLARVDLRNDGQVFVEDAIVPGSTFLGAFRADHWSITLPFRESTGPEMWPLSSNNRFPRRALIKSILEFVNQPHGE